MYKSKNIKLRPFTEEDAVHVLDMKTDFAGLRAFAGRPYPNNLSGEKEWISKMYPAGNLNSITLVVEEIETKKFIGYVNAIKIDYINSNAQVGVFFHKNGRGKGYFKEASKLFYAYLFNEINLYRVYSGVLIYNKIALENDMKIGFKEEGIMKNHIFQNGKYYDMVMVGMNADDFFKQNNIKDILDE